MKIDQFRSAALMNLKGEIEILIREETPVVINRDLYDYRLRRFFRSIAQFFGLVARPPTPRERFERAIGMFKQALKRRYGDRLATEIADRLQVDKLTGARIIQAIDDAAEMLSGQLRGIREGNDKALSAWLPASEGGTMPEGTARFCQELFLDPEVFAGDRGKEARALYRERMLASATMQTDAHTASLPPDQATILARQELEQIKSDIEHGKVLLYQREAPVFIGHLIKAETGERQALKTLLLQIRENRAEEALLKSLREFDRRAIERMVMTRSNFVRRMMEIPDRAVEGTNEWVNRRYIVLRVDKIRQGYMLLRKLQIERWTSLEISEMTADDRYETMEQALSINSILRGVAETRWSDIPGRSPEMEARRLAFGYLQVAAADLLRCLKRLNNGFPDRVYSFTSLGEARKETDAAIENFCQSFLVSEKRAASGAGRYVVEISHGIQAPEFDFDGPADPREPDSTS